MLNRRNTVTASVRSEAAKTSRGIGVGRCWVVMLLLWSVASPSYAASVKHSDWLPPPSMTTVEDVDFAQQQYETHVVPRPVNRALTDRLSERAEGREVPPADPGSVLTGSWEGFAGVSWGCNGQVNAMAEGNDGLVYLGGSFSVCGDVAANNVVAYNPAKNQFLELGIGISNGVDADVFAIEVVGSQVYVGGAFSYAGGMPASRVAAWNGGQWVSLGGNENINGTLFALHWYSGGLYVGGSFSQIGAGENPLAASRIALWANGSWSTVGEGVSGTVYAITSWNDRVFLGGTFTDAGGEPASRIVAWDGEGFQQLQGEFGEGVSSVGGPIVPPPAPPLFSAVFAMSADANGVFVGGDFNQAGGRSMNHIAYWDGSDWSALGEEGGTDKNGTNSTVRAVAVRGSELVVGGFFSLASGTSAWRVARWNGESWHTLGAEDENGIRDGFAYAVLWTDDALYTGGFLLRSGSTVTNFVSRFDFQHGWQALGGSGYMGIGGIVTAVLVEGNNVYVGGRFGSAGDLAASGLARWDGQAWQAVLPGDMATLVNALALDADGHLIVGGNFSRWGPDSVLSIARWDGHGFRRVADGILGFPNATVEALSVSGDDICVGGNFTEIWTDDQDSLFARGVGCLNGGQWQPLEYGLNPDVTSLAHLDDGLYVGSKFSDYVARWDGEVWDYLDMPLDEVWIDRVNALASYRSELFVGGGFFIRPDGPLAGMGAWDGSEWVFSPGGLHGHVDAISPASYGLFATGNFIDSHGATPTWLHNIGLWNGTHWRSLGPVDSDDGGLSGRGQALSVTNEGVWVGGSFNRAGDQSTAGLAFFRAQDGFFHDRFEEAKLHPGDNFADCDNCPTMVVIPGGTFTQGAPESEPQSQDRERPQRTVNVPAFAMGQTEVTFDEWDACVADGGCTHDPSDQGWGRGNRPVISVNWHDVQEYVTWLSNKTGHDYRLPSESEREYATRAGTTGRFNTGDCITTDQANFYGLGPAQGCPTGIYRAQTLPVGSFAPNAFGLYDTHGNVWEWVQDCWNTSYNDAPINGSAWMTGDCSRAVLRGGSWNSAGHRLRSANRGSWTRGFRFAFIGFRVARSVTL